VTARSIANRANAAHSTGPRTRRGKARASRNALRHGLATRRADDSADAMRLAGLICDAGTLPAHDHALIIAECCLLIARVRRARAAALERMALDELSALERYERRALSRRRRAMAALAMCASHSGCSLYRYNHEFCLAERTQCVRQELARLPPQLPARDLRPLHHRVELRPHDAGVDLVGAGHGVLAPARGFELLRVCDPGRTKNSPATKNPLGL